MPASLGSQYTGVRGTKWYRWTAPITGHAWAGTTAATTFDTVIGVYQGNSLHSLTMLGRNNDFLKGGQSMVAFPVTEGEEYRICVAGVDNSRGDFNLNLRTAAATVTLTFDTVGGLLPTELASTFPVPKNAAVGDLPTPTKDYYTFSGWYTKKSGGSKVTAKTKFTKPAKLYARWAKNKFKVVAKAEGTGAKTVKGGGTYAWGTKVKLSATAKSGYVFRCWVAQDSASENAFPNYSKASRKNATATVTVPKDSGLAYKAYFVKKSSDGMSLDVLPSATLYAEDGAGSAAIVDVNSMSYPTVKTSKLPAGVKFSLVALDDTYKLVITDPDKIPAGKKQYALSFLIQDPERTLTDQDTERLMERLLETFKKDFGAQLR